MAANPSGSPPTPATGLAHASAGLIDGRRAYHQRQWKSYNTDALTINTKTLALNLPLDNGRLALDSLPPRSSCRKSSLLSLPPEILHLILQHLSIKTITIFRHLSTTTRSLVSSNPLYAPLFSHTPASLRAILSTGIGPHITLLQLHIALTHPECSSCGKFGDFFHLLTGCRICHACFATSPRHPYHADARETYLLPISISIARSTYGLSTATLTALPTVRSIPGLYGREKSNFKRKRLSLCLPRTARELGIAQHGGVKAMNDWVEGKRRNSEQKQRRKWENSDWTNGGMIVGRSTPDFRDGDFGWDNPFRHMVVVRFPWVRKKRVGDVEDDRKGDLVVEWGVPCEKCREKAKDEEEGERRWNVRFSREGLVEHLKSCM